ncbi:MAG: LUD domain-containing protein [Patescibacteria group bacterium]|nr:LUD domain-containing protein [Patescibacteria group bacterium]
MDFETLKSSEVVDAVTKKLLEGDIVSFHVGSKTEALDKIKNLIPAGASVMNGSSTSLDQIGFVEYLKSGDHPWINLHERVLAEPDQAKKVKIRREVTVSDYHVSSVQAVTEEGQLLIASGSGSNLPGITFNAQNVIFVVSTNKIVKNLDEAMKRLKEYVWPKEDVRMKEVGMGGSVISKILIYQKEPKFTSRTCTVIFVDEKLGF